MAKVVYLLLALLLVNLMLTSTSQGLGMFNARRRRRSRLQRDRREPTATDKVVDENWEASKSNIDPAKKH